MVKILEAQKEKKEEHSSLCRVMHNLYPETWEKKEKTDMITLKQTYWENCDKLIKCDFPCDSCFGCKNKLKEVKEWLQQKPQEFKDFMTISKDEYDLIEEFVRRLLEELEEKEKQTG
ncbi:MAG: hypothetical protein E3J87_03340 [Candidatus Cloacimonadota bacterium]|nr:MAG: hypothetical protein E3J87_03340 [Candidatus Cloacimonadota bacterium]